jgi:hypothetical protein
MFIHEQQINDTKDSVHSPISECGLVYKFSHFPSFLSLSCSLTKKQIKVLQKRLVAADSVGHAESDEMTEN